MNKGNEVGGGGGRGGDNQQVNIRSDVSFGKDLLKVDTG